MTTKKRSTSSPPMQGLSVNIHNLTSLTTLIILVQNISLLLDQDSWSLKWHNHGGNFLTWKLDAEGFVLISSMQGSNFLDGLIK